MWFAFDACEYRIGEVRIPHTVNTKDDNKRQSDKVGLDALGYIVAVIVSNNE